MHTITAKANGSVLINGVAYQIGSLLCVPVRGDRYRITTRENTRNRLIDADYSQITDPTTNAPFASGAALMAFTIANFYLTEGVGAGGIQPYVDQFAGSPDGNYTLTYIPLSHTLTAEVNGVGGTPVYSGSGKSVTFTPDFDVDEQDTIKFTYAYNEADN